MYERTWSSLPEPGRQLKEDLATFQAALRDKTLMVRLRGKGRHKTVREADTERCKSWLGLVETTGDAAKQFLVRSKGLIKLLGNDKVRAQAIARYLREAGLLQHTRGQAAQDDRGEGFQAAGKPYYIVDERVLDG